MITSNGLEGLGFKPFIDFVLRDDGNGVYISEWNPTEPVPSVAEIEQGEQEYIIREREKEEVKEAIRSSAMRKLVENAGLTIEEVRTFLRIDEPTEEEEE